MSFFVGASIRWTISVLVQRMMDKLQWSIDAIGPTGEVFIGASNCHPISPGRILKVAADGDIVEFATGLGLIHDIVFDSSGNMYVVDFNYGDDSGGRLVKVSPSKSFLQVVWIY